MSTFSQLCRHVMDPTKYSFKFIPSVDAHITHSFYGNLTQHGIQSHIFITTPEEAEFKTVLPNSVYIAVTSVGALFKKFTLARTEALVVSLEVYFHLLEFFHTTWPTIRVEMEKKFKEVRKKNHPCAISTAIHFYLSGTVYFEKWFGDSFLHFKKCSTDFTQTTCYLQRGQKCIHFNPEAFAKLAVDHADLLTILVACGYNEGRMMLVPQASETATATATTAAAAETTGYVVVGDEMIDMVN